ncbi:MAG: transketolase [Spirochaetes bacterium]|jgi:transketolase|nr:transketolase [Spirochaetota bacterium]
MSSITDDIKLTARTIRTLAMDAVQKARSGHPGMPMGCAEIAAVLWGKILVHNPADPRWPNRDRFVLSAGHGSVLLYSVLHFSGYGITLDDIKNFRQMGSITPGHPEHNRTVGVETTTGPLGQGFANGIGMAIASRLLGEEFNTPESSLINHYVYAIVSDGDIMEGLSAEAASLAGHMGLGNIIYLYDFNRITIEGSTDLTFSEDVRKRFEAYNWHVQEINGHDPDAIEKSIRAAQKEKNRPSIIIANTTIAKGSASKEGSEESHGAPLGDDEVCKSKEKIGCSADESFVVPAGVYEFFRARNMELSKAYDSWQKEFTEKISGQKKTRWDGYFSRPDIHSIRKALESIDFAKPLATRESSGKILETIYGLMPNIIGGSADLGPSNKSFVKGYSETGRNRIGRNIHFGIREHAMGSIQNGLAYYGGFIPYAASFLAFMDYMRPAVRLAALGKLHTIYIFTHDSIFVGEDGPTHQPIEHLASARAIPNLHVIRPADAEETRDAWLAALSRTDGPTMLSLTRQALPPLKRNGAPGSGSLENGAYIISDTDNPDIIILASGSEVSISVDAAVDLAGKGIKARVVSFPCWELFDGQPEEYRKKILGHGTPKAVVEAGIRMGWEKYAGSHALYITIEDFGVSAPYQALAELFGFTKNNIVKRVSEFLSDKKR